MKVLQIKEHIPIPSFDVFIIKLAFESYKEFGGASLHLFQQIALIFRCVKKPDVIQ
jgi:hypothetical protein